MAKNKKAEKKKANPFDVTIILLLICLVATFGYKIYAGVAGDTSRNVSEYVIEFEGEDCNSILSYLKQGNAVYLSSNDELLGYLYIGEEDKIGPVYTLPEEETGPEEEAISGSEDEEETVEENLPIYKNIRFGGKIRLGNDTIRVKNGNYYTVGGINLTRGSVIEVYTEKAIFTITVKSIETVNE